MSELSRFDRGCIWYAINNITRVLKTTSPSPWPDHQPIEITVVNWLASHNLFSAVASWQEISDEQRSDFLEQYAYRNV